MQSFPSRYTLICALSVFPRKTLYTGNPLLACYPFGNIVHR